MQRYRIFYIHYAISSTIVPDIPSLANIYCPLWRQNQGSPVSSFIVIYKHGSILSLQFRKKQIHRQNGSICVSILRLREAKKQEKSPIFSSGSSHIYNNVGICRKLTFARGMYSPLAFLGYILYLLCFLCFLIILPDRSL